LDLCVDPYGRAFGNSGAALDLISSRLFRSVESVIGGLDEIIAALAVLGEIGDSNADSYTARHSRKVIVFHVAAQLLGDSYG
jgi:hypothetical protein